MADIKDPMTNKKSCSFIRVDGNRGGKGLFDTGSYTGAGSLIYSIVLYCIVFAARTGLYEL